MTKICFVCTGNTCRSIMAERLMKKMLKDRKIEDVKVSSRGLNANGENITDNAKQTLKAFGSSSSNRKSVKLGKIDQNTTYVTMTEAQKNYLNSENVISYKELLGYEIIDPYGQSLDVYKKCAKDIMQGINILIEKLELWRWKYDNISKWPRWIFTKRRN